MSKQTRDWVLKEREPELLAAWNAAVTRFQAAIESGRLSYDEMRADPRLVRAQERVSATGGVARIYATRAGLDYIESVWAARL